MFRPNFYGRQRNNPPEWLLARTEAPPPIATTPINFIPPISGNTINGVVPWYLTTGQIFKVRNAGIPYNLIGRGVYFQYVAGWTPTAAIGNFAVGTGFAIGVSGIFLRKPYHEIIYYIGGIDNEIGWGLPVNTFYGIFILDVSLLDGPAVLI